MPYLKCVACRIRLDRAGPEANLFDGLCPICGVVLEPAPRLSALIGFQAFDLARGESTFEVADRPVPLVAQALEGVAGWTPPTK